LLYAAGGAAQGGASFLLLPFLSVVLDIEEFATLSLITASSAVLQTFIGFNSVSYPMVAYHERREALTDLVATFHSVLLMSLLPVLLAMFLVSSYSDFVSVNFGLFICIHAIGSVLVLFRLNMLQMAELSLFYFVCQVVVAATGLGASIFLVVNADLGLDGRLLGLITPIFLILAALYLLDRPAIFVRKLSFDSELLWKSFKFGISFLPYKLIKQVRGHVDKFISVALLGMADMAILAMAISISIPVQLATVAVEKAFTPTILKQMSVDDDRLLVRKISRPIIIVISTNMILSLLCYLLVLWLGPYFIDEKYSVSFSIVHWLIIGIFMQSVNSNLITIYSKLRKGALLSKLAILHFFNHLVISVVSIHIYGIEGAAIGYMLSYTIAAVINGVFIRFDLVGEKSIAV
jgi:O-antigen/teichoic acid export membrane protein